MPGRALACGHLARQCQHILNGGEGCQLDLSLLGGESLDDKHRNLTRRVGFYDRNLQVLRKCTLPGV